MRRDQEIDDKHYKGARTVLYTDLTSRSRVPYSDEEVRRGPAMVVPPPVRHFPGRRDRLQRTPLAPFTHAPPLTTPLVHDHDATHALVEHHPLHRDQRRHRRVSRLQCVLN